MGISTRAIAVAIAGGVVLSFAYPVQALAQEPSNPGSPSPAGAAPPAPPPPGPPAASPETSPPAPVTAPAGSDVEVRSVPQQPPPPMGGPVAGATPFALELPSWMHGVTLGAGALLWYYQPIALHAAGVENDVSVYWANLVLDGKWGAFGVHVEPRFRDTPLRPFFGGPVWLQEAYGSVDFGPARLRIGKTYSHLGYFWDNSFYGNIQVYDGLKLDPDYGASLEGDVGKPDDTFSLGWWAQYFVVDGSTNVSLPGRDTISIPGARRRNQTIVRLEPRLDVGPAKIVVGVSGEYLQADLPSIGPQNVWRGALDAKVTVAGLSVLGEVQHQDGRSVTDFPNPTTPATATSPAVPGSSSKVDYAQIGAEYTLGPVTARYNVSLGSYTDVHVKEWLHVPGVAFAVSPNLSLLAELVFWQQDRPGSSVLVDRSFNLTLYAHL
jgi:hypothetical protein